jgi:hypothetical protein
MKRAIIVSSELPHPFQQVRIQKSVPNCHDYLQQAVTPDWMGRIALCGHITAIFSRAEKIPLKTLHSVYFDEY